MSKNQKKKNPLLLWILLALAAVLVVVLLTYSPAEEAPAPENEIFQTAEEDETKSDPLFILDDALCIEKIGQYTGIFVEDGSDEPVTGVLMMHVTNITEDPIQYAEITLDVGGKTARFTVSVLPAGATAVLIEQSRMAYSEEVDYTAAVADCGKIAGFDRDLTLQEDKLKIQILDGGVNIQNISGADITETIVLTYKNINNGVYHGGIAYRVRLEGGLKADELRQIMVNHIYSPGTELMFVDLIP